MTGVQTCTLPICGDPDVLAEKLDSVVQILSLGGATVVLFNGPDTGSTVLGRIRSKVAIYNENLRTIAARHDAVIADMWSLRQLNDPQMWNADRLHFSPLGHHTIAAMVLDSLNVQHTLEPLSPKPLPPRSWREARSGDLVWAREYFVPWVVRRLRHRSSGDGMTAKRPLVTEPYSFFAGRIASGGKAEADVNNDDGRKKLHYVFVPEDSAAAVAAFNAQPVRYANADAQASRYDNGTSANWPAVKRVTYELQDIADILPTHWEFGGYATHWLPDAPESFFLESPVVNEAGQAEVSTGMQRFFSKTRDIENEDDREGYPAKKWFFGTFELNSSASDTGGGGSNAFHDNAWASTVVDSRGRTRASASGYSTSPNAWWWQHDYFVHSGAVDSSDGVEQGFWLPGGWYLGANGGFDGRWVQLFDDRPGVESGVR